MDRVTNVEAMRRMHKKREILSTIRKRISNIINHYAGKDPKKEIHRKETKLMTEEP